MAKLLLNSDLGESFGLWTISDEIQIMPYIDQANLACGFHAGDFTSMATSVALAVEHNIAIGAHPGYPDLQGFGRRHMQFSPREVKHLMLYQMGALEAFCQAKGTRIAYVKPHGALYNAIADDEALMQAAMEACARFREGLPLMTLARTDTSKVRSLAAKIGVPVLFEAFADRRYLANGNLSPRQQAGSVLTDIEAIKRQVLAIATAQPLTCLDGERITLHADSLCVHGDNPEAIAVVKQLRQLLDGLLCN